MVLATNTAFAPPFHLTALLLSIQAAASSMITKIGSILANENAGEDNAKTATTEIVDEDAEDANSSNTSDDTGADQQQQQNDSGGQPGSDDAGAAGVGDDGGDALQPNGDDQDQQKAPGDDNGSGNPEADPQPDPPADPEAPADNPDVAGTKVGDAGDDANSG